MLAKDLKKGDIFYGFPMITSEDYDVIFLNCYEVLGFRTNDYIDDIRFVSIDNVPMLFTDDDGIIIFPKNWNVDEPLIEYYCETCVFCYCSDLNKITELFNLCLENKFRFIGASALNAALCQMGTITIYNGESILRFIPSNLNL